MYKPRCYQGECIGAIEGDFQTHDSVMIELFTGGGKTVIFTLLAHNWPGRVLIIAPRLELITQAAKKVFEVTGEMPAIEQAELTSNESEWARSTYVVGMKQSLCSGREGFERFRRLRDISLVIIDECHMSITDEYRKLVQYYQALGAKILGVTATAERLDGLGMKNLYSKCSFKYGMADGIEDGWLVRPKASCIHVESMDLSKVKTVAGDFAAGELNRILEDEEVELEIADITVKQSDTMKTVVFCKTVAQAAKIAEILKFRYGKKAEFVCSDTRRCSEDDRRQILESFTTEPDGVQFVCNVGILTTGWDFPGLEHIVMARPTQSIALFTQILGRATRPLPGVVDFEGSCPETRKARIAASEKPFFYVTDLVDNSRHHKIKTVSDVLAGKWGFASALQQIIEESEYPITIEEAREILEERKRREAEEQRRKEAEEAARRELLRQQREAERKARIRAEVEFQTQHADIFGGTVTAPVARKAEKAGARFTFGKHRGELVESVKTGYLEWFDTNIDRAPPWLIGAVRKELENRMEDPVIDFGKHDGTKVSDLPRGYLHWLVSQDWVSNTIKKAARETLDA